MPDDRMLDELKASLPDDMPPLEPTNHLVPLKLVAQLALYDANSSGRMGVQDDGSGGILRAHRDRLRQWLATNIPIQYGKRAIHVEQNGESVVVQFEDGTTATGDVVVGAEGPRSAGV
jgi:flavin-dependent dehydrogenase